MRPWILAETNFGHVKDCEYEVAVLPMGATEPHNLHLPYGTDTFEAEAIGSRVCEAAWKLGCKSGPAAHDSVRHGNQPVGVSPFDEPDDLLADISQWRTEACCFGKWLSQVLK